MYIYDAEKAEEMAVINEPILQALNASIEQRPVLTAADLGKALQSKQCRVDVNPARAVMLGYRRP